MFTDAFSGDLQAAQQSTSLKFGAKRSVKTVQVTLIQSCEHI